VAKKKGNTLKSKKNMKTLTSLVIALSIISFVMGYVFAILAVFAERSELYKEAADFYHKALILFIVGFLAFFCLI
jgi:flagellar biosynthesis protein FlhB